MGCPSGAFFCLSAFSILSRLLSSFCLLIFSLIFIPAAMARLWQLNQTWMRQAYRSHNEMIISPAGRQAHASFAAKKQIYSDENYPLHK